ncbi:MAG: aminopeptidase P family N-terminal domain-containing protein [Bacteroidia bacterium]|nr:aminopeptidase P family N-terminal domain-containing protein [Bacteroidia bacterium]
MNSLIRSGRVYMINDMHPSKKKISRLRRLMKVKNIDVYLIPSADPHLGEYIPDHWRIIQWLTGFTGSAATVVITGKAAGLWTDSRYFIQAEEQLTDSGVILMKPVNTDSPDLNKWIKENTPEGGRIGMDGRLFSITRYRSLEASLKDKKVKIVTGCDLITDLWDDRPLLPESLAFEHEIKYAGISSNEKIERVREKMRYERIDYHLLTSPDDIMWLLNIRGMDVKYSPLLLSFALIGEDQILLFADEKKIPFKMASGFDKLNIVLLPYEEVSGILSGLNAGSTVLISPSNTSTVLFKSIPKGIKVREDISIVARMKSIKNKTEIANIDKVMIKDGVALIRFFYWLEKNTGKESITELKLTSQLEVFRSEQENYLGPSFCTIAAFNEHGALPHYSVTIDSDSKIKGSGLLLVDSGGQYLDGTTDITRTIAIGRATAQQKKDFTLVLKGMINLAAARFPFGTRGVQLDILARRPLWEHGLNFNRKSNSVL